jgi:hypothetical protein
MPYKWYIPVQITTNDATGLSAAQDFGGGASRIGIVMPAAWVAGVGGALSFQVAATAGGTYYDLYNEAGGEVHLHPTQQKAYSLDTQAPYLAPFRWVKVRSGLTGAAVTQTNADAIIGFFFMR